MYKRSNDDVVVHLNPTQLLPACDDATDDKERGDAGEAPCQG